MKWQTAPVRFIDTIDGGGGGGGGVVVGVVVGGDVVDGGGSGVDGVEDMERTLNEGRGRVEIVVLDGNPSGHFVEEEEFSRSRWVERGGGA